jgi:hypothetical protein
MAYDTAAVKVTVEPRPAFIEQTATAQLVNFDLIVENTSDQPLDVDEVQLSVYDRANQLVLRKFVDGNGTRPSIRTIDVGEVPAKGKALIFNPFDRFDRDLELGAMTLDLKLSSKDGQHLYASRVTVTPKAYSGKAALILPVQGRLLVYDGHDFYAHHRRWDYTIPGLQQLGFRTNFMRYSYDLVPVNAAGAPSQGDEEKNESWFGFGREIRAAKGQSRRCSTTSRTIATSTLPPFRSTARCACGGTTWSSTTATVSSHSTATSARAAAASRPGSASSAARRSRRSAPPAARSSLTSTSSCRPARTRMPRDCPRRSTTLCAFAARAGSP